jgi:CubicO group peptidase (beta-lactamase class C family)
VTFHHLLSHTSGIPNFTSFPQYVRTWMMPSRPEETIKRFRDLPLEFEPGTKWKYSNSGYVLLGHLLERVSGEKYEDYMRKHVLEPAGMFDSGHDTHGQVLMNRATGYSRIADGTFVNSAYHDMSIPIGGGDLYSTVTDMYKWDQALSGDKVLSDASRRLMFTPVRDDYGYGWLIQREHGTVRQSHGGGINGFATYFSRYPEKRVVIVVLGNMDFANSGEIAKRLAEMVLKER